MKNTHVVLGISPRTRGIGIAVAKDGNLIDWRLKNFKGEWSKAKLHSIIFTIYRITCKYRVSHIAVKMPLHRTKFRGADQLMSELFKYADSRHIPISIYSLSILKNLYCSKEDNSVSNLMNALTVRFPELYLEYSKEQQNFNPYYVAMFEAVAVSVHASESSSLLTKNSASHEISGYE